MLKSSLTLTIPTFNEEENIRIPLDSTYDLVDEVLIINGGSTDKTVEIVKLEIIKLSSNLQIYIFSNHPQYSMFESALFSA